MNWFSKTRRQAVDCGNFCRATFFLVTTSTFFKLAICADNMLRGGLLVALDRTIAFTTEFVHVNDKATEIKEKWRVEAAIIGRGEKLPLVSEGRSVW